MKKKVTIIIPAYNEADNINPVFDKLEEVFQTLNYDWDVIFVDDGSTDETLEVLIKLSQKSNLKYISLSRNFGKDEAIKAGIDHVNADLVITMDADLQHPPSLIPEMINKWELIKV